MSAFPYAGYVGKYLRVDLTHGTVEAVELERARAETFLGGNGWGVQELWAHVGPEVEPLSPANELIVATGPLCGSLMPNSSRVELIAKSPLTGIYGDANSGGMFGPELKFAGYDMILLTGRAPEPVYLEIDGDRATLRSARHLWGLGVRATMARLGAGWRTAVIGPAGERGVRYASVQLSPDRSAARSGLGAVMGSKNLKAIAVRGSGAVPIADPAGHYRVAVEAHRRIRANAFYGSVSRYGTPGIVTLMNPMGRFPTKNFQLGSFPWADDIGAEALRSNHLVHDRACFNCPIGCDKVYRTADGDLLGSVEYETLGSLGAGVWVRDLDAILRANILCDDLGLDTISAGRTIACAMELWERGLLTAADTDGLALDWGDGALVERLLGMIARREGLGDRLAEGALRFAQSVGPEAVPYAMVVKGQEIAAQDGRAQRSMGLAHVTSSRGADHLKAFPTIDETGYPSEAVRRYGEEFMPELVDPLATRYKPMLVKDGEDFGAVVDSAGNCKSGGTFVLAEVYWGEMAEAIRTATGMDVDVPGLKRIGERIYNLQRCYNVRHGITRVDDRLPPRFREEPNPSGHAQGCTFDEQPLLDEYYALRGWDVATGVPARDKLEDLGLAELVGILWSSETSRAADRRMGDVNPSSKSG